jgi:hypothetical protein
MRQEGCFKEFVSFTDEQGEERYDSTFVYALLKKVASKAERSRCRLAVRWLNGQVSLR